MPGLARLVLAFAVGLLALLVVPAGSSAALTIAGQYDEAATSSSTTHAPSVLSSGPWAERQAPLESFDLDAGLRPVAGSSAPTSALDVLPYPTVTDPKLQNYVDNLYKGTTNSNRVGTGTTADAVRNELTTGLPTGGTFHSTKAQETINGLTRWLRNNPDASYSDRLVAQSLLDDLVDALGTAP